MVATKKETDSNTTSPVFNRIFYGGFVTLGFWFAFSNNMEMALSNLGIALIFDPFDQKVSWTSRSFIQKALLMAHLGVMILLGMYYWLC